MSKNTMQFSEKNLPLQPVTQAEFERFTEALELYFEKIDAGGNEEDLKNNLAQFFNHIFEGKNEVSSQGIKGGSGIDMVIYLGKTRKSKAGVHIEVKSPANTSEMISPDKLNRKAFHESVLYFLFDKIKNKNNESKYIIITNLDAFYIFDAQEFTRLFIRDNKSYSNEFEAWKNGQRNDVTTKHMYEFISEKMTQGDKQISGYHIQLNEYRRHLRTLRDKPDDFEARNRLAQLCHIFSPQFLLKQIDTNDSNTLNKDFYHELLHIMGLKEVKEKGKKLIKRKPEAAREHASMLENTISEIRAERITSDENEQFDIALELCLTWVNRILFLKLLESQLYQYNNENDDYKFLTHKKIQNYDQLKTLFFQVLAIQIQDREAHIKKQYNHIPYLNSSLFDPTPMERKTVQISGLKSHYQLSVHPKTQLQDRFADGKCPTLEYFLRFLDAYDFGAVGKQELIREERKPLINAAVLGLIFEKINGYKEGSFYTPGFVTMYMCHETIRPAVLQKINNQLGWNCEDLREVRDKIDNRTDRKAVNETINTLTICDPAVGSGHFLVSALNEIIAIKAELGVILDHEGNCVKCYISIEHDELQVEDEDNAPFSYYLNSKGKIVPAKQILQEALFREKQTIIENCLFGVDINPNSVKICQLRLWIELLKNAFYTEQSNYQHLETLPNIDINIKCGNSLISRFPLDENLNDVFKKQKYNIQTYKNTVAAYRATRDGDMKQQLQTFLDDIKDQFQTTLASRDPLRKRMSKLRGEILLLENPDLFTNGKRKKPNGIGKKKKELAELEQQKQDIESNKVYQNAFEWRFEFPEVLDANGEFVGFDLIIGNPPWGVKMPQDILEHVKRNHAEIIVRMIDSFMFFTNISFNITSASGYIAQIIPDVFLYQIDNEKLRAKILSDYQLLLAANLGDNVFKDVARASCIIVMSKNKTNQSKVLEYRTDYEKAIDQIPTTKLNTNFFNSLPNKIIATRNIKGYSILARLNDTKLIDLIDEDGIQRGISPDLKDAFIISDSDAQRKQLEAKYIKPTITGGRDIERYYCTDIGKRVIYTKKGDTESEIKNIIKHIRKYKKQITCKEVEEGKHPFWSLHRARNEQIFTKSEKILGVITGDKVSVSIDRFGIYPTDGMYLFSSNNKYSNVFIIGLLNSKLITYLYRLLSLEESRTLAQIKPSLLGEIPVKEDFDTSIVQKIESTTLSIIDKVKNGESDYQVETTEIDQMVYDLYGLTKKEIKIIEAAVK